MILHFYNPPPPPPFFFFYLTKYCITFWPCIPIAYFFIHVSWNWIFFRQICVVNYRLPFIEFGIFIYLLCFHMKQMEDEKAELQYPKSVWWHVKPSNKQVYVLQRSILDSESPLKIKALKTLKWYLSRKSMSGIKSFKETYCSDIGLKVNPPSKWIPFRLKGEYSWQSLVYFCISGLLLIMRKKQE